MKALIAEFVNARQIQELFKKSGSKISYNRATKIKKELKNEHADVKLPDARVIPLKWVLEAYGETAYAKKKDV